MALNSFFKFNKEDKEIQLKKLREKLRTEKGLSKKIALREAEKIVFKPENVERIKMDALKNIGYRPGITFYFNDEKEIKLVAKYFNVNFSVMGVDDSSLLLDILKVIRSRDEAE